MEESRTKDRAVKQLCRIFKKSQILSKSEALRDIVSFKPPQAVKELTVYTIPAIELKFVGHYRAESSQLQNQEISSILPTPTEEKRTIFEKGRRSSVDLTPRENLLSGSVPKYINITTAYLEKLTVIV